MPDNLTKQFKAQLANRGITASDSDINNFISQQPNLFQSVGQPVSDVATQSSGFNRSLDMLDMTPDQKGSALDAVGAFLWRGLDATLLGIPGIALGEDEPYQWDTLGTGGKAGAVFGEALGFLAPLGVISKIGRAGVSAVKGTGAITRKAIREAGSAAKVAGLSAQLAQKSIKKTLRNPIVKDNLIPKYGLGGDDIAKVEGMLKDGIVGELAQEFPKAGAKALDDIGETVIRGMKSEGVHVNNIGHWVEKSLNTTFNVADKSKITRYAGRFAETGANFAVYNLLSSGIQSMAGRQEFDPSSDVGHAFMFSSLLPAVEMVGGGGKVRIIKEANRLRKMLGKFDTKMVSEYKNMSGGQLNGLLRVLTRENYLKDTLIGKEAVSALRATGGKDLAKGEAIEALERIAGRIDPKKMWTDFRKYAGEDFVQSLGRMMLVGFYFNSSTLLDYDLLKNMDSEILGAHLLTGMMFGKIKKPLFQDPHPTLNGFQERRLALEYFGMDASNIEAMARNFTLNEHQGAAYSGIRVNSTVQKIANIINTDINEKQSSDLIETPARVTARDKLLIDVFNLYNLFEVSGRVKDADPKIPVSLKNLTRPQLTKIKSELAKIDIGDGETLTVDNFNSYSNKLFKDILSGQYQEYMDMVLKGARELGVQVDKGEAETLDMDSPVGVGRIEGLDKFVDKDNYLAAVKWQQIRDVLDGAGFIKPIRDPELRRAEDLEQDRINNTENAMRQMVETLRVENYGETVDVHIEPSDNGFLDALRTYKVTKNMSSAYNIVEGSNMTERERALREWLVDNIGDRVPKSFYNLISTVELSKGDIKKSDWDRINAEGEYGETIQSFKNILKIWGINKQDGRITSKETGKELNKIDYIKAKEIINLFEKQGFIISDSMTEQMNRYYYNEFLKTSDINIEHQVILEHFIAHGVGQFETRANGKKVLVIPDRETKMSKLEAEGRTEAEIEQDMKKDDAIMRKLNPLIGTFLETRRKMSIEDTGEANFYSVIQDAYTATEAFGKDVMNHYDNVRELSSDHSMWISRVKGLLESRKLVDGEKKEIVQFENEQEAKDYIAELDALIKSGKEDINLIGSESIEFLENLRNKIVLEEGAIAELGGEYESSAKLVEQMIQSEGQENFKLIANIEAIIFDINNYSGDKLQARRRMERLLSSFSKDLKSVGIELKETDQLVDIAELYAESPNRTISDYINKLSMSLRAWRKGYDEKTYFQTQKEFSQEWSDASGLLIDPTPRYSASYISQTYGRYNESLKGPEWVGIQEGLRIAREEGVLSEIIQLNTESIVDNVRSAINIKNEGNIQSADAEFTTFMRHVFPSFLSHSIGTQKVMSSELDFDPNGKPIISLKTTSMGKGAVSMFVDNMGESSIRVFRLENTGVLNGRKIDTRSAKNVDELIKNASIIPGESNLRQEIRSQNERGESYDETLVPFQDVVGVITSFNNRFLVAKDNLTDLAPSGRGILNERFKAWYDNKLSEISTDALAVERLKALYGEFVEKGAVHSTDEPVRQMVRAMYWDSITKTGFTNLVKAVDNQALLGNLGASYFKYFSLAESVGAKTQGSLQFLREINNFNEYFSPEQRDAIDYSLQKHEQGGYEIVSLKDESGKAFSSERLVKEQLRKQLKEHTPGSESYNAVKNQIDNLLEMLPSLGDGRSSIDAHTHLGTNAANAIYLHRGRVVGGMDGNGNTAGVKPTAWFNDPSGTIMLKTNFTYDPQVAEIMDRLGIDILTTESASKFFNADLVDIKVSDVKGAETFTDILEGSGKFGADRVALEAANNISRIGIENIFIGKSEDRHGVTNLTYALSDFLDASGYKSHMESYVDYDKKVDKSIGTLKALVSGKNRNAAADYLMESLREQGALFEDGTTGLVSSLLEAGVDPNSIYVKDTLQRSSIRHLVNELRNPKTKGASYSVLIPFLEGTQSVYDGNKRIINGGKKAAYEDGNLNIDNWNNVKYIISFNTKKHGKRDLQAARDKKGNWIIDDPYAEVSALNSKLKTELKRISVIEKGLQDSKLTHYKDLFNKLDTSNKRRTKEDTKFYINSHTLRMPNLGGDVSAHRIEGYYDSIMSNVTGINITDLATIHQGDFDADMAFNYYDAPGEFSSSIFKLMGASKDAYVYASEGAVVDVFNNGGGLNRAGLGGDTGDSMSLHQEKYMQGKINFGAMKRVTAGLSAISRMATELKGIETLTIGNNKDFNGFLQRYKNVLQSIIDSTKSPNFASEAENVEDVMKFVLFDHPFKGSEIVSENLAKYGEGEYQPFFKINEKEFKGNDKEVLMDTVIESIRALGRSSRFLSDVWDESGRRPPEANDIANMKSDLYRFVNNPNKQVFITLLGKHTKNKNKQMALIKLFYGAESDTYRDRKALLEDIYSKKLRTPEPSNEIIFFGVDQQQKLDSNPGNYVVSRINQSRSSLLGYSTIYNKKASQYNSQVTRLLDDIQMIGALAEKESYEGLFELLNEGDVSEGLEGRLKGRIIDGSIETAGNIKAIQNYSILSHMLGKQRSSLARYIRNSGKSSPNQVARAQSRLRAVDAVMEYFRNKEDQSISEMVGFRGEDGESRHKFYMTDLDFTGKNFNKPYLRRYENNSNDVHYIYKEVKGKDGVSRFEDAGSVRPKGTKYHLNKGKYVVLKNPIKWNLFTNEEILDGNSMFKVTGDVIAENIHLMTRNDNVINNFMIRTDQLRSDIGTLARDTYKLSEKSPHQMENWKWESKEEDALVREYMEKWLHGRETFEEPTNVMSDFDLRQRTMDIVSYVIKPKVVHGNVAVAKIGDTPVPMPVFKPNKRLGMAMFRWLKENGHEEIFNAISRDYGSHYRQGFDNVIPESMSDLHTSQLYHRGEMSTNRSAIIDLVYEQGVLYQPNIVASMLHVTRNDMKKYANKSKVQRDAENNLQIVSQYGDLNDVKQMIEVYKDPKDFKKEENYVECG
jgi:hypothetical protein